MLILPPNFFFKLKKKKKIQNDDVQNQHGRPMPRLSMEDLKSRKIKQQESTGGMLAKASSILLLVIFLGRYKCLG
jgi:hypothetical protein